MRKTDDSPQMSPLFYEFGPPARTTPMTVKEVRGIVHTIRSLRDSDAHRRAEQLYVEVLTAISTGQCTVPKAVARAAVKVEKLRFPRWFD